MGEVQQRVVIVSVNLPWGDVFGLAIKLAVASAVVAAVFAFLAWPLLGLLL